MKKLLFFVILFSISLNYIHASECKDDGYDMPPDPNGVFGRFTYASAALFAATIVIKNCHPTGTACCLLTTSGCAYRHRDTLKKLAQPQCAKTLQPQPLSHELSIKKTE